MPLLNPGSSVMNNTAGTFFSQIRNLPPLRPKKSKGEKVEELLAQINETKTISKVPLGNRCFLCHFMAGFEMSLIY